MIEFRVQGIKGLFDPEALLAQFDNFAGTFIGLMNAPGLEIENKCVPGARDESESIDEMEVIGDLHGTSASRKDPTY